MGLVLSRRKHQTILIGPDIRVTVSELHRSSVKLLVDAPKGLDVVRAEVSDGEVGALGAGFVEPKFVWRGSVTDLVTDIRVVLSLEALAELAGEAALAWREERLKLEQAKKAPSVFQTTEKGDT